MAYMQMGVSVPIKNYNFRTGLNVTGEVNATYTAVTPTPTMTFKNCTTNFRYAVIKGDKITIGPSTHTSNPGARQELEVSSVSNISATSNSVTFTENIIYAFMVGDPITGVGMGLPGGWTFNDNGCSVQNASLYRLNDPLWSGYSNTGYFGETGIDDYYAFTKSLGSNGGAGYFWLYQNLGSRVLNVGVYYRFGVFYRSMWSSGSTYLKDYTILFRTYDSGLTYTTLIDNAIICSWHTESLTQWAEYISSPVVTGASSTLYGTEIYITYRGSILHGSNTEYSYIVLDNPYIEHAAGTTDASSAVYTFPEYPNLGSQKWSHTTYEDKIILSNGSERRANITGSVAPKWTFTCSFANVSMTFLQQLQVLHQWQKVGNKLILHTNETPGGRIPPIIIGYMDLSDISQGLWDLSKVSFDFSFTQAD
jgi:hypothetical protein